ncbi:YtxH domain-containing protein [Candidatus Saccharibacteria bacterium]|nr:YtxH domain-containing protein [Candidatus Saccharibacteria bacterium]
MRKEGKWVIGAAVAAGVGYAVGVLTAPRSGWRTRKKLAENASKTKTDAEKQLKQLHTDLGASIDKAEKKLTSAKTKANAELKKSIATAKTAKNKTKLVLSALHNGEAADPDLRRAIDQAKKAKANLSKFYKK